MTFKDYVNKLSEITNYKFLYLKLYDKTKFKKEERELLKKAFKNKKKNQKFKCNETKIKKILNAFKKLNGINTDFIEELCKHLSDEDLKDIEEIKILSKDEVTDKETLKKIRILINNYITNLKNANKPYFSIFLLRELIKGLISLHNNVGKDKVKETLNDNSLSLKKLKFFNDNLKWISNKLQILTIITLIPENIFYETAKELKKI